MRPDFVLAWAALLVSVTLLVGGGAVGVARMVHRRRHHPRNSGHGCCCPQAHQSHPADRGMAPITGAGWPSPPLPLPPVAFRDDDAIVTVRFGGPDDPAPPLRRTPDRFAFPPSMARPAGPASRRDRSTDFAFPVDRDDPPMPRSAPPLIEVELIPIDPDEEAD